MHIHHIEIAVQSGLKALHKFINQFGFTCVGARTTNFSQQWVLKNGHVTFLITQADVDNIDKFARCSDTDPYIANWGLSSNRVHGTKVNKNLLKIDTAFNVALEVDCVDKLVDRVAENGGMIVKPKFEIRDGNGTVDVAVVKSCIGNVVHTLVSTTGYAGAFLPKFQDCTELNFGFDNRDGRLLVPVTHVDHVAYACEAGSADDVIKWYGTLFGMQRFFMNKTETECDGFVFNSEDGLMGLRLKALKYDNKFKRETNVHDGTDTEDGGVKFVLCEPLQDAGSDQMNNFLREHHGEGVHHLGLHTPNIVNAVSSLQQNHVEFSEPPFTYYTEAGKLDEIRYLGEDVNLLQEHGILVDGESDSHEAKQNIGSSKSYLMQKFTKPLFDRETFFLELIQRKGATGFGAGNISALWNSVQAYLNAKFVEPTIQ